MPIKSHKIKTAICVGVFKVLRGGLNLRWPDIKDQDISILLTSVANPTSWKTFFSEAIGIAIQQELVFHGSYCPGLEDTFVEYEAGGNTWEDLEMFIDENVRNVEANF